jgi:hypothetical protein
MNSGDIEYLASIDEIVSGGSKRVEYLALPGHLEARLDDLDGRTPLKRVFVMGCGRSGTWLLLSLMFTFEDTAVLPREVPVQTFGLVSTSAANLVLKREWKSYYSADSISENIWLLYIVRHPYDVLTSFNPVTGLRFHISPARWLVEMSALRALLERRRKSLIVVRYEDLVSDPKKMQDYLASALGMTIKTDPENVISNCDLPQEAVDAMHGLRKIDNRAVGRYRNNEEHVRYLKSIQPRISEALDWTSENFRYDLDL